MWWGTLVTPALRRQRQTDLWNSRASQHSPPGKFQASGRPYLKKVKVVRASEPKE